MRPSRLRTGILFIGLGVALLLYNMDRLEGWYFVDLLQLWPILLVGIGLEILARHSNAPALGYLSPLLVAGAFIYAGTNGAGNFGGEWSVFESDFDRPRMRTLEQEFVADSPIDQARYFIDLYNGHMRINPGGENLGHGEFRSRGKIRTSISENEGLAVVRVRQSGASREEEAEFDVYLAEDLPLTLDLKADDATIDLDGEQLSVHTLYLEIASGAAHVTLGGGADSVWANLSTGSAELVFRLPDGAGLRLEGESLPDPSDLGDVRLVRNGLRLETEGFEASDQRFVFFLEEPVAQLTVSTY